MIQQTLLPQVYVDLDDVVAQTIRAFIALVEARFQRRIDYEGVHSFHLGQSFHLSDTELKTFLREAHEPSVLEAIEPVPGARETLARMTEIAHVVIVTGRPTFTYDVTLQWLRDNRIPHHAVRFLKKYVENDTGTPSIRDPLSLRSLRRASFTVAIEDSPKMAKHFAKRLGLPVALMDKPWNRELTFAPRFDALCTRCKSWSVVEQWFQAITHPCDEEPTGA